MQTPKDTLVEYLQTARDAMVWKVEGLSEYDARRPMTPTGFWSAPSTGSTRCPAERPSGPAGRGCSKTSSCYSPDIPSSASALPWAIAPRCSSVRSACSRKAETLSRTTYG